jgi:hypothetical protein
MEFKRNLKSLDNKTGNKIVKQLNIMMDNHDKYKSCYFWTNTGNATNRRRQEFTEHLGFIFQGKKYEWNQELSISCKNFYWNSTIFIDDKKSNITAIKKLLK